MADPDLPDALAGLGEDRLDLGEVCALRQGQVHGDALEPGRRVGADRPDGRRELLAGQAVALHAAEPFQDDAGVRLRIEQRLEVVGPADGVHDPVPVLGREGAGVGEGPPRREDQQVAGVPVRDLRQLLVGADRQRLGTQPVGLAGQPAQAEAVAVALRHRHQPGLRVGDRAQVRAPAVAVDGQLEGHASVSRHPRRRM